DQGKRTGYKRDKKNEVVVSRLDESTLSEIARITGGQYYRAGTAGNEVDAIATALDQIQQGDVKSRVYNRYENRFQWPWAAGILLMLASLAFPETGWRS